MKKKYFVIGFNKTATTSFHHIFQENGIKSMHRGHDWDIHNFDACSDNGNLANFKAIHKCYPNANYILNVRNPYSWVFSRFNHGFRLRNKPNWAWPPTAKLVEAWMTTRELHHQDVLNFFTQVSCRKKNLTIINIDEPDWIEYFCKKFGFDNQRTYASKNITKTEMPLEDKNNILSLIKHLPKINEIDKKWLNIFANNFGSI